MNVVERPEQLASAPRRAEIRAIWERILQQSPIDDFANFFDLGGDSLLALQLFAEVERVSGRRLPITAIYDAPTVAALTELLEQSGPLASPLLVPLNPGDGGVPVFLVHGIGGNVMDLTRLGRSIGGGHPVYAIQARGVDGLEPPLEQVEAMADAYVAAIREVQPAGPYVLVGYSFGGFVVLEMARRLERAGERVALLAMLESYAHPSQWPFLVRADVRIRRFLHRAGELRKMSRAEALAYVRDRLAGRRAPKVLFVAARDFAFDDSWPETIKRVYDGALAALLAYRPVRYPGRVVFFRGSERPFFLPRGPGPMWRPIVGRLEVIIVPGDHHTFVNQRGDVLGARLTSEIAAALRGP